MPTILKNTFFPLDVDNSSCPDLPHKQTVFMKKLLTFLFAGILSISASAQSFNEGDKIVQVGIGVGSPFYAANTSMVLPPMHISGEYGFSDKIGIGGLIGFAASKYESTLFGGSYSWSYKYLIIGGRGSYHFYNTDKIDAYGGVMLGANIASAKFESDIEGLEQWVTEPKAGGVAYGFYAGGRYYLSDKMAVFGEVGYNIAWVSAGLSFKL